MLKKYSILGFILLCCFASSGHCTTRYDEDNYWSKHGRYGRDHRHDDDRDKHHKHKHNDDHHKHHKHKHDKNKHHKHHSDKSKHGKHH